MSVEDDKKIEEVDTPIEEEDDHDDEIESARESIIKEQEEAAIEDEADDEEEEAAESTSYYDRTIMNVAGSTGKRFENLQTRLVGKIALSVTDEKEGFLFEWAQDELEVEKWSGAKAPQANTVIEVASQDLEAILRGRLNPQVAMLSHKVTVTGEMSQAVYLFNLFEGRRR